MNGLALAAAAIVLMVLALAADLSLRPKRKQRVLLAGRLREVGTTYAPQKPAPAVGVRVVAASQGPALWRRLVMIIGYDPAHRERYAVPWWLAMLGAGLVAWVIDLLFKVLFGDAVLAFFPAIWLGCCRLIFAQLKSRHRKLLYRQFPDALGTIVRAVRVGIPVPEGMRMVGHDAQMPTAREFSRLADRIGMGIPIDEALREMAEATAVPEYRFFATAIGLQAQTGGALAETLDSLADVVRRRVAMEARGHALAGEAKMSMYILGALPVVAGGGLSALEPDYIAPLIHDHKGNMILAAAILTVSFGFVAMHTIIRKSLS
jgi:tight adherence protein B